MLVSFDINLHSLPGTDEVSWDVIVGSKCIICCCGRSLRHALFFQLLIISVLGSGYLFSLAQGLLFVLFAVLLVRSELISSLLHSHLQILFMLH
jgi:hypothetical protein